MKSVLIVPSLFLVLLVMVEGQGQNGAGQGLSTAPGQNKNLTTYISTRCKNPVQWRNCLEEFALAMSGFFKMKEQLGYRNGDIPQCYPGNSGNHSANTKTIPDNRVCTWLRAPINPNSQQQFLSQCSDAQGSHNGGCACPGKRCWIIRYTIIKNGQLYYVVQLPELNRYQGVLEIACSNGLCGGSCEAEPVAVTLLVSLSDNYTDPFFEDFDVPSCCRCIQCNK